jgi:hypothetical protein
LTLNLSDIIKLLNIFGVLIPAGVKRREIAFKKFSDNKMIVKYLEQGQ